MGFRLSIFLAFQKECKQQSIAQRNHTIILTYLPARYNEKNCDFFLFKKNKTGQLSLLEPAHPNPSIVIFLIMQSYEHKSFTTGAIPRGQPLLFSSER